MIRRSLLFIPGNNPGMIQSADVFNADGVIIDLEDSVSIDEKDSARILLKEAMQKLQYEHTEVLVRINPYDTAYYEQDFEVIKDLPIDAILLPKADSISIRDLDERLAKINSKIQILVLIETALGVEQVFDVLSSTKRCAGLMLGGEDLCVDLNCKRTKEGMELLYARTRVVNAAKALKKTVIDTPFTDTLDEEGLKKDAMFAKGLGFDGKASINPRQIEIINEVFSPTKLDIEEAIMVMEAKRQADEKGLGVFSLNGKMVDLPIIKRAERIITTAKKIGLIKEEE
jgi:citrate lyase subunit beta / citryl-CoA lyase